MAISTKRNRLHMETLEDRAMFDGGLVAAAFDLPTYGGGDDVFENPDMPAAISVPAYSSKPDAPATLYLDFNGHYEAVWGTGNPEHTYYNVETPAFELFKGTAQEDYGSFNDTELRVINEIWQAVAEDYAPFNVNVTTVDPGDFSDGKAVRVAIGGSNQDWYGKPHSGVGLLGSFNDPNLSNTVYVFDSSFYGSSLSPANAVSHEAGHAFGLRHQSVLNSGIKGQFDPVKIEYNPGDDEAGPIMGNVDARGIWWQGDAYVSDGEGNFSFTYVQDDMAMLKSVLSYRADDHSNAYKGADNLGTLTTTPLEAHGIIEQTTDADWFKFDVDKTSNVGVSVQVLEVSELLGNTGANLDAKVDIYRFDSVKTGRLSYGTVTLIASADPEGINAQYGWYERGANISMELEAGTYYAVVRSHGDYGDVGQYTVSAVATKTDTTSGRGKKLKTTSLANASLLATSEQDTTDEALQTEVFVEPTSSPTSSRTSKHSTTAVVESLAGTSNDSYEAAVDELFDRDNEVELLFAPMMRRMV